MGQESGNNLPGSSAQGLSGLQSGCQVSCVFICRLRRGRIGFRVPSVCWQKSFPCDSSIHGSFKASNRERGQGSSVAWYAGSSYGPLLRGAPDWVMPTQHNFPLHLSQPNSQSAEERERLQLFLQNHFTFATGTIARGLYPILCAMVKQKVLGSARMEEEKII